MQQRYALIGNPLSHSWSAQYHTDRFRALGIDATYTLHPMSNLSQLRQWVADSRIGGFNVTIPYKKAIIPLLDSLDEAASQIGAVNCVKVGPDGTLRGYNTDAPAFLATLRPLLQPHHDKALVLGTGGAAMAVAHALTQLGIARTHLTHSDIDQASSGGNAAQRYQSLVASHPIIVNATPVGMYPATDESPCPFAELLTPRHLVYDLVYNPAHTLLLRQAAARGAATHNGLDMLHLQADLSWQIWSGK